MSPENLESFLLSWKSQTSKKPLSLLVDEYQREENAKIIEKYKNLGIVKEFNKIRF